MPALRLIPPAHLKEILFMYAYEVIEESSHNWILKRGDELPLVIGKHGDLVAREVMEKALCQAKMNNETYFRLLDQVEKSSQLSSETK